MLALRNLPKFVREVVAEDLCKNTNFIYETGLADAEASTQSRLVV